MNLGSVNAGKVIGNRRLARAMRRIPYKVKKNKFLLAVFRAAAKPIIAQARIELAKYHDTGTLAKSIKAFSTKASRKLPAIYVGPKATGGSATKDKDRGGGFYGAMLEYGTPTASARPFMRPAWDKAQTNSEAILLAGVEAIVQKILIRETKGMKKLYS